MVTLADNALTTWTMAKGELGLTDSSLKDSVLLYINALSAAIARYCGREFHYEAARVESVAGFGGRVLQLAKAPVVTLTSITLDGDTVDVTSDGDVTVLNANAGQLMKQSGWAWTTCSEQYVEERPQPGQERKAYEVTYACGYITPKQEDDGSGTRTLPYDIEYALLRWLAQAVAWKGRDPTIKSEKLTTWAASYVTPSATSFGAGLADPPPQVAQLLAPYQWGV